MGDLSGLLVQVGVPVFLLVLALFAGRAAERRHFRRLEAREGQLAYMLVTDIKSFPGGCVPQRHATLVLGQAVIASDYLKRFLARLRNIFGGEMRSYETLLTRARREAILRMLDRARTMGYDAVCNVRINTATIGRGMVEALASGTAYRRLASEDG